MLGHCSATIPCIQMTFHSKWRSNRNYLPFVMAIHSKWLRNNPQGPKGPLGPEGAQGARRAPPLGPIGSLGPRRCAPANLKKTRNDIMALRVRFVATLLHSKGAAVVPQGVLGYHFLYFLHAFFLHRFCMDFSSIFHDFLST